MDDIDTQVEIKGALKNRPDFTGLTKQYPGLRRLSLVKAQLQSLEDIDRVLPDLEHLDLTLCAHLQDVSQAYGLKKLRLLNLTDCRTLTDISALNQHPALGVVLLWQTTLERKQVPLPLRSACTWQPPWKFSWGKLSSLAERGPPLAAPKRNAKGRGQLANLKKLMTSKDRDAIDQALELVRVLDDVSLFDQLTKTIHLEKVFSKVLRSEEERLTSTVFKGHLGAFAMLRLIAAAPPSSRLSQLSAELKHLDVVGKVAADAANRPFDLRDVNALSALESLTVMRHNFVSMEPVHLTSLSYLTIRECLVPHRSVGALLSAERLQRLEIWDTMALDSLEGVEALPLKSLCLIRCAIRDLSVLHKHPTLESVDAQCVTGGGEAILTLPKLKHLRVDRALLPSKALAELRARGVTVNV